MSPPLAHHLSVRSERRFRLAFRIWNCTSSFKLHHIDTLIPDTSLAIVTHPFKQSSCLKALRHGSLQLSALHPKLMKSIAFHGRNRGQWPITIESLRPSTYISDLCLSLWPQVCQPTLSRAILRPSPSTSSRLSRLCISLCLSLLTSVPGRNTSPT